MRNIPEISEKTKFWWLSDKFLKFSSRLKTSITIRNFFKKKKQKMFKNHRKRQRKIPISCPVMTHDMITNFRTVNHVFELNNKHLLKTRNQHFLFWIFIYDTSRYSKWIQCHNQNVSLQTHIKSMQITLAYNTLRTYA